MPLPDTSVTKETGRPSVWGLHCGLYETKTEGHTALDCSVFNEMNAVGTASITLQIPNEGKGTVAVVTVQGLCCPFEGFQISVLLLSSCVTLD